MGMETRMVRALSPIIGPPGLAAERSIKGTSFGTIGKKSPAIFTLMRVLLLELGVKLGSELGSGEPVQYSIGPRGSDGPSSW